MARLVALVGLAGLFASPSHARAQGHGPVFGLSTPTLGAGRWSVDLPMMGRVTKTGDMLMLRPMVSYGITEDLQVSASLPMPLYRGAGLRPTRVTTRMPATSDVELTVGWRFHRKGLAVGTRVESTAYVSLDYPTEPTVAELPAVPGFAVAAVTGYASRSVYVWGGGLYRRYTHAAGPTADRVGDLVMYSLVLGYRPPFFREDVPKPDWRIFVEAVGEWSAADVLNGADLADTGGHRIFIAPTLLGLYGAWGIAGGPALSVYDSVNGTQPADTVRWVVNLILWF